MSARIAAVLTDFGTGMYAPHPGMSVPWGSPRAAGKNAREIENNLTAAQNMMKGR